MAGQKMMGGGGPRTAQAPAKKSGQFQQRAPASTPQQDQAQAEALSGSLSDAGSDLSEQGSAVEPGLPFTQHAADFRREEVSEERRAAEAEFPSESATLKGMADMAEREISEAKAARAAGDKRLEFIHMERACDLYNAASDRGAALETLAEAARLLRGAEAPAELVAAMKGAVSLQSATPAAARAMLELARAASDSIRSSPAERLSMSAMFARAFFALGRGKAAEAGIHRDLAKEYARAGPRDRKKAETASASLAKGVMSASDAMALISILRTGPSGAGIPPGEIRERILALQSSANYPEREQDLAGLLGPALSYLAKAEDAKRIGDDAKAAEYIELSLLHLEEAEKIMEEIRKPAMAAKPVALVRGLPHPEPPKPETRLRPVLPAIHPTPPTAIFPPPPAGKEPESPAETPPEPAPESAPLPELPPELLSLLSEDCCAKCPDGLFAWSEKAGVDMIALLGELYSSRIRAAAGEIPEAGITGPLAMLSGFAEKMPSIENLRDARAAAFLAEFYLFAGKRELPGREEAGRMIIELADMVMTPEDALSRLSELAGVKEAQKPTPLAPVQPSRPQEIVTPGSPQHSPQIAVSGTDKPAVTPPAVPSPPGSPPGTPQNEAPQYAEFGSAEKFVSFAQRLMSADEAVRSGAEAKLGTDPASSVIRRMISDMKSKKLYAAAVSRGDRFGIDRFVKFDVPKLAREWIPEFEKATGIRLAS
ncbi:MAG: hypothetical protein AB1324_01330 [Candidatus Micrarchaeota archaeon]